MGTVKAVRPDVRISCCDSHIEDGEESSQSLTHSLVT